MPTRSPIRVPQQARSKETWRRIVEAGRWLLENEGRKAVTVAAVCERADIAPTAIYRRVDGLAGLFWAIYEDGMVDVTETYTSSLAEAGQHPTGSPMRVSATVAAVAHTFDHHTPFLRPIITQTIGDQPLESRGRAESLQLVEAVADLLDHVDRRTSMDVGRMLHHECVTRIIYGPHWLTDAPESQSDFVTRLQRWTTALLSASGDPA